jgi:hypothetical protein
LVSKARVVAKRLQKMKGDMDQLERFLEDEITRVSLQLEEKEKHTKEEEEEEEEEEEDAQLSV